MNKKIQAHCSAVVLPLLGMLAGCEAPLDLSGVEQTEAQSIKRFDMFQDADSAGETIVLASSAGAVLVSRDGAQSWTRFELDGSPGLIDAAACANGDLYTLDSSRHVWRLPAGESLWQGSEIDTPETTLSIHCSPSGQVWVSASFATLFSSDDAGQNWTEFSLYDDMQITEVQFVDSMNGFAVGEFGLFIKTVDGGLNWERGGDIPNEFYPMAATFSDLSNGWVGGLDGVIWHTADGGETWTRQVWINPSPVYRLVSTSMGVFAAGGSATLVRYASGEWVSVEGAPHVPTYLRALAVVGDQLVIAGGGGLVANVPLDKTLMVPTSASQPGDDA